MKSIGNDIVDLSKTDLKRTITYKFYAKFVHSDELDLYKSSPLNSILFSSYIWFLWSVKEAAYKYLKRLQPELLFSPINIIVSKINVDCKEYDQNLHSKISYLHGAVSIKQHCFYFSSAITGCYISSVVSGDPNPDNLYWETQPITNEGYETQSFLTRKLALSKINTIVPGQLTICKSETGYPVVHHESQSGRVLLSLAHHGSYMAYAFVVEPELLPA